MTVIRDSAFESCKALKKVVFGGAEKKIERNAFAGCGLTGTLTLPDTLTSIDSGAFGNCAGLTKIRFGAGLRVISDAIKLDANLLGGLKLKDLGFINY